MKWVCYHLPTATFLELFERAHSGQRCAGRWVYRPIYHATYRLLRRRRITTALNLTFNSQRAEWGIVRSCWTVGQPATDTCTLRQRTSYISQGSLYYYIYTLPSGELWRWTLTLCLKEALSAQRTRIRNSWSPSQRFTSHTENQRACQSGFLINLNVAVDDKVLIVTISGTVYLYHVVNFCHPWLHRLSQI